MSIESEIQRLTDAKSDLASAIEEYGVSVASDATLDEYPDLVRSIVIPTALPNPHALTFTGAATGTYDGSKAVEINIPEPQMPTIEHGSFQVVANSTATTEYTQKFEAPYETAPFVFINLVWTGNGVSVANNLFATVVAITETEFTVRIYNNDSTNRTIAIRWIVI